jgi:DNA-binding NarL/FixJ family response regulator
VDTSGFSACCGPVILIVEDHRAVRQALRELMHVAFGAIEVLEAANVNEALRATGVHKVDVVLMDIKLPGIDGVAGTRKLLEASPRSMVVMVSNFDDAFHRHAADRAGAKRFVSKRAIGKELVPAIEALLAARAPATGQWWGEPVLDDAAEIHARSPWAAPPASVA